MSHLKDSNFELLFLSNSDTHLTIKLPQQLIEPESQNLKQLCFDLLDENHSIYTVILDFSDTKLIDSSGIGALINIRKKALSHDCEIVLQQTQPHIIKILEISGLAFAFRLKPTTYFLPIADLATHPSLCSLLKRLIDLAGAIVGLGIMAIVFLPVAIAVKIDTPGPIFFRQTRCGWLGQKFCIWKFRSMCINAETMKDKIPNQASGAFFKNNLDPRVTRVGRFLRRTSLDELPQFWNVLKGDMSLVGTRPPTLCEVKQYRVSDWQRLNIKPGMTGEWQVNGRSKILNFEDVVKLDLNYQKKWSIRYDLKLILKTIMIVFQKNNGAM